MARKQNVAVAAVAACALLVSPPPNAVVHGSRPSPYGFCIPYERFEALRRHHAVAFWLATPTTASDLCGQQGIPANELDGIRRFNLELGLELPVAAEAEWPAGVPIWRPPEERTEDSCCVWIWSLRDGWVSPQVEDRNLGFMAPTHAEAASDSGSTDITIYPVPIRLQRAWQPLTKNYLHLHQIDKLPAETPFELRQLLARWNAPERPPEYHFSFSQWVSERSNVARTMVTLPLAAIDGTVRFAEPPTVHWFDAYGKETSPFAAPTTPIAQLLVSATGGASIAWLWLAWRQRRELRVREAAE